MDKTLVQCVLELWGECMSPENIAVKLGIDEKEVRDIIERERNYEEANNNR